MNLRTRPDLAGHHPGGSMPTVIAHTNLYWQDHRAPGRTAGTVSTADADFG